MLAATLESLADQGMPKHRCEVVVKDDGSRDATPEICRDFASWSLIIPRACTPFEMA